MDQSADNGVVVALAGTDKVFYTTARHFVCYSAPERLQLPE